MEPIFSPMISTTCPQAGHLGWVTYRSELLNEGGEKPKTCSQTENKQCGKFINLTPHPMQLYPTLGVAQYAHASSNINCMRPCGQVPLLNQTEHQQQHTDEKKWRSMTATSKKLTQAMALKWPSLCFKYTCQAPCLRRAHRQKLNHNKGLHELLGGSMLAFLNLDAALNPV